MADSTLGTLSKRDQDGSRTVVAGPGAPGALGNDKLEGPVGLTIAPNGEVYFTEPSRIRKVANGQLITVAGGETQGYADGMGTEAKFKMPFSLVVDPRTNDLYVSDTGNARIRRIH